MNVFGGAEKKFLNAHQTEINEAVSALSLVDPSLGARVQGYVNQAEGISSPIPGTQNQGNTYQNQGGLNQNQGGLNQNQSQAGYDQNQGGFNQSRAQGDYDQSLNQGV